MLRQHTLYSYAHTVDLHQQCYDTHAEKFSHTRKKKRPEFERIGKQLQSAELRIHNSQCIIQNPKSKISILELWCGDGRLAWFLSDNTIFKKETHHYTGVDISSKLLARAKENHPDQHRVQHDMVSYVQEQASESVDVIICVASFHHIPDRETREYFLQQVYRILRYGGVMITIDRSRSYRMMRKYWKAILRSLGQSITSFGRHEYNTLTIPFHNTTKDIVHERVYHFFTRRELRDLATTQWYIIDAMTYSHPDGSFSDSRSSASNICTLLRKDIFLENEKENSSFDEKRYNKWRS